jgi:hypothetical protein
MFHCPNCHNETELFAPVCNECNNSKGILETMFFDAVRYGIVLTVLYFGYQWLTGLAN